MKKLFAAAALCALLTPAFAGIDQGIDTGMTHVSILGGLPYLRQNMAIPLLLIV